VSFRSNVNQSFYFLVEHCNMISSQGSDANLESHSQANPWNLALCELLLLDGRIFLLL
jgi:hypothetical protein